MSSLFVHPHHRLTMRQAERNNLMTQREMTHFLKVVTRIMGRKNPPHHDQGARIDHVICQRILHAMASGSCRIESIQRFQYHLFVTFCIFRIARLPHSLLPCLPYFVDLAVRLTVAIRFVRSCAPRRMTLLNDLGC